MGGGEHPVMVNGRRGTSSYGEWEEHPVCIAVTHMYCKRPYIQVLYIDNGIDKSNSNWTFLLSPPIDDVPIISIVCVKNRIIAVKRHIIKFSRKEHQS